MAETIIDTRATSTLVLTRGNTGIVTATGEIDIASQDFAIDATDTTATVNGSVHSLGTAIILIRSTLNIGSNPEAKVLGGINAINGGVINNGGLIQGSSLIQGTGAVISGRFQALTINNTGTIQAITRVKGSCSQPLTVLTHRTDASMSRTAGRSRRVRWLSVAATMMIRSSIPGISKHPGHMPQFRLVMAMIFTMFATAEQFSAAFTSAPARIPSMVDLVST
jgi:hypothetical protein